MRQQIVLILFVTFTLCCMLSTGFAKQKDTPKQEVKTLRPYLVEGPMKIDGVLEEPVWLKPATVDDIFITYNPTDGLLFPKKTRVWLAYDTDHLYFAFYCHDEEPDKIKTSITKRDNLYMDDWVGVALDPHGNHQSLYELFINPSGMQGDLYSTPTTGENGAPDWVWFSGGRIVEDGYTVEVKLPLKSIRFRHGENVSMRLLFWRRISRLAVSGAWPALDPGLGPHNSTAEAIYGKLDKQLLLEFIPTLTYSNIWDREDPDTWVNGNGKAEFGISGKYGITSAVTIEGTYNPDFSQVESDSFQILHNQRYPIFYQEKRPFFMEASDLFEVSGSHDNMHTAVHTRKIVDPLWGGRLTGDLGRISFGILAAEDEWPGREIDDEDNFYLGKQAYYGIGRVKFGFNGDSHVGMLFTDKELDDYHNRVAAFDTTVRFAKHHTVRANAFFTDTNDPEEGESYGGNAFTGRYSFSTKSMFAALWLDRYEEDFRMDTAFYQRTGIASAMAQVVPIFSIDSEKLSWWKAVKPVLVVKYLHDDVSDMDDRYLNVGVIWDFIKQGYLTLAWDIVDDESWEGTTYDTSGVWGNAGIQLTKWLNLSVYFEKGKHIYYDEDDPFLGKRFYISLSATLQPIDTLSFRFAYKYMNFDREDNGEDVYDYHILFGRATYQPTKHLYFRALLQYDSYVGMVLGDILASYEFVPGTVAHIGYGSLHEKLFWDAHSREWRDDVDPRGYYHTSQSFFVKVSYRLQF